MSTEYGKTGYRGHIKQFVFRKNGHNGLNFVPMTDPEQGHELIASASGFGITNEVVDYQATRVARAADPTAAAVMVNSYEVVDALPHSLSNDRVTSIDMLDTVTVPVTADRITANNAAANWTYVDGEVRWASGPTLAGQVEVNDYLILDSDGTSTEHLEGYVIGTGGTGVGTYVRVKPTSNAVHWDNLIDSSTPHHVDVYVVSNGTIVRGEEINDVTVADARGPAGNGGSAVPTPEVDPFNL